MCAQISSERICRAREVETIRAVIAEPLPCFRCGLELLNVLVHDPVSLYDEINRVTSTGVEAESHER